MSITAHQPNNFGNIANPFPKKATTATIPRGTKGTRIKNIKNGSVGIGLTNPAYEAEVNGDAAADAFFYRSDKRLKKHEKFEKFLCPRNL